MTVDDGTLEINAQLPIQVEGILGAGHVNLISVMGGDYSVVDAARISYAESRKGKDADDKLIRYLLKHDHGSPFEMVVLKFQISCPVFVMRQWIRHRVASYNEVSARYTEIKEEFFCPEKFRVKDKENRQGSVIPEDKDQDWHDGNARILGDAFGASYEAYKDLIDRGVCYEQARIVLPLATFTQFIWTVNVRSLFNFLRLRMDKHAQWEIQEYAKAIFSIFERVYPALAAAFSELYIDNKDNYDVRNIRSKDQKSP